MHNPFPLLKLRNQLASNRIYLTLRNAYQAWREPKARWQRNVVATVQELRNCGEDSFVALYRGGELKWRTCSPQCLNRDPVRLPWWWYRNLHIPDLGLIMLHNVLAFQEDHVPWGPRRQGPEDWTPIYGYVWTAEGLPVEACMRITSPWPNIDQATWDKARHMATTVKGTHLFLGWLSKAYGHFLVESLAHLWPLLRDDIEQDELGFTAFIMDDDRLENRYTGQVPQFLTHTFERLGIDLQRILWIQEPIEFERLLVPTPSLSLLRRAYGTALQGRVWETIRGRQQDQPHAKVYLSRRKYQLGQRVRRPLRNEADLEDLFRQYGFEIVYPETLTFPEQLELYGKCSVLAGPVGSNMHNSAFLPNGARVLIIAPTSFVPIADHLINAPRGIRAGYYFVPTADMEFDSPQPWEIDVSEFATALEQSGFLRP